ncbi:4a-hydroxytetrahydrobiopterin dehydratase [Phenylobacterium sp.]|uniref:4a-hydroxytetrahydrobiopterin dehydratase n=1 Tax=Phenylobacterium sp. TaxID=1871053 RepID=UPI002734FDDB|nr:4a-hydroxytetrahydrobiopterin dehydratase [Phenylobacterium sp.]MDP3173357.1 4a-hydroxytetrahydrobiopterin dehydratase [Phenylobacterium sp.]MDP3659247.1 4a-hydroxytetrahydrobiopterin dehydratase [Phenylobacterium sp.]
MSRPARIGAAAALARLPGWNAVEGRDAIHRTFEFDEFNAAFGFMTRVAMMAETMQHHPEWSNLYGEVSVTLATHEVEGVTERDVIMASFMDQCARSSGAKS